MKELIEAPVGSIHSFSSLHGRVLASRILHPKGPQISADTSMALAVDGEGLFVYDVSVVRGI